ncbi:formylglycine-generating enzyme [Candidatus Magnetomoraceae bacterium gMMP-13]
MQNNVFINYRSDDTAGYAIALYKSLSEYFHDNQIFIDVNKIEPGEDFTQVIENALNSCKVLIVLIGRNWLSASDERGRRLDNPNDFVRLEISTALKRNIRVIPVLLDGVSMPRFDDLPDELASLTRRHALDISNTRFNYDVDRLIKVLEKILKSENTHKTKTPEKPDKKQNKSKLLKIPILFTGIILILAMLIGIGIFWASQNDLKITTDTSTVIPKEPIKTDTSTVIPKEPIKTDTSTVIPKEPIKIAKLISTTKNTTSVEIMDTSTIIPKKSIKVTKPPKLISTTTSVEVVSKVNNKPEVTPSKKIWKDPITGMDFVWIPKGCFKMGSPESEKGRDSDEGLVHEVCVDGFWMGKYEVTNAQYRKFKSNHNSKSYEGHSLNENNQPVVYVSWNDIQEFIKWLNGKNSNGDKFRLPTEAEWEYACRAGSTTSRFWGNDPDDACKYGNVADHTAKSEWSDWTIIHDCVDGYTVTAPVGSFRFNKFGLYDMLGNIWEWCQDIYSSEAYSKHQRSNPIYANSGSRRVIRGGGWGNSPGYVRCADRYSNSPGRRFDGLGFRLVRTF